MCTADTSAARIHLIPSQRGGSSSGHPENIILFVTEWRHALGRIGAKRYALPSGMRTECAAGSLSWSTFSENMVSIYYLLSDTFLSPGEAFRLANYVCHRTDRPKVGVARPFWSGVAYHTTRYLFGASPSWLQPQYKLNWPVDR